MSVAKRDSEARGLADTMARTRHEAKQVGMAPMQRVGNAVGARAPNRPRVGASTALEGLGKVGDAKCPRVVAKRAAESQWTKWK